MPDLSALTIAYGRDTHLANVVLGFEAQSVRPAELVIGVMQDRPYDLPATSFPVRQIHVTRPDGELPLAAARNRVADAATGEVLAFVDVDCIPHPDFVAETLAVCTPETGILMGEVAYLPSGATEHGLDFDTFEQIGQRHSDRQGPPPKGMRLCNDYRCFWSLNFAMHRDTWATCGKFHEGYYGYGGEDTDFARTIDAAGLPIWWMRGAKVFHQHHAHCMPPIQHLASVLRNADVFAERWGHRTMGHWLWGFSLMGLIEKDGDAIRILREPDESDYALCRQTDDMPYANSRRVIDILQASQQEEEARRTEVAEAEIAFVTAAE
ncbi:glycosyltransferase family 2 protein [Palleronia sp. LCG004]|uniref:glycosyltransferase family 2 protein n=1 Tax=Palleronia sp. LCG004 TaxID=3079304 RepID=UPI002941EB98|nr:glycosyltransferase [Palleronia sp. LCG004]WOI56247.1 glycosyltransferase [Palleronia sp. LCG004]